MTALLVCLAAALAATGGAGEVKLPGIIGDDNREPLDSGAWPWLAIGRVHQGTGAHCTGILVAPDVVLTAAHCLYHARTGRRLPATEMHFVAGYRRGDYVAHGRARAVHAPSEYRLLREPDVSTLAHDWALLCLPMPMPITPVLVRTLTADEIGAGRPLSRAGYSQDRPHLLSVHAGCRVTAGGAEADVLVTDCDATRGDSGSPLMLLEGDHAWVVGVTTGVVSAGHGRGSYAVNASQFADPAELCSG